MFIALDSLTATVFPELRRTDKRFYEGHASAGKATFETFTYNASGDIVELFVAGDTGVADDVSAKVDYFTDAANYITKPNRIVVKGNGQVMRERASTIEAGTGDTLQVRQYLADGSAAVTDLAYDSYGNLIQLTGPANYRDQRYTLDYTYDPAVHTYNVQVADSFGYVSGADYDLKCGQAIHTRDLNNQPVDTVLDEFCRITEVIGPYQTGSGLYTLQFEYHHDADTPWAVTRHIDVYRDENDPIETVLFVDGLNRVVQTKKDSTLHNNAMGNPKDQMVVSGLQVYDFVGRSVAQYYPVVENLGNQGVFNPAVDAIPPTVTAYDVLDRTVSVTLPDQTSTAMFYDFGSDRAGRTQFLTRVTDAEGQVKESYKDINDNIVTVKEFLDGQAIFTSYDYDPLKQIVRVTDDHGHLTSAEYDNLGRRTAIDSPDAGRTETGYDLASNVVEKITANLRAQGQSIEYSYDYKRLSGITYPNFDATNVSYTYGAPGAPYNRANRVVTVTDQSGSQEFFYGKLGETVKTIRTISSETQGKSANSPEVYTTEYEYDTFNRLQQLVYPDGEVLTHQYDSGGLLRAIFGDKAGWHYDYLSRLEYDKFDQRVFVSFGNGTRSFYSYNPYNRRLAGLQSGQSSGKGRVFQDLSYSYDKVGNILGQANAAAVNSPSQMGGATQFTYVYDDLYRLVSAAGTFDTQPNKQHRYTLAMTYDTIHNILHKNQYHELVQPSTTAIVQKKTTYNWLYDYEGSQPHAPTHIYDEVAGPDGKQAGRTFTYDANGNQEGWTHDLNGTLRKIAWDDENRIQSIADNGHLKTYKYDHSGTRVMKMGPQGETVYVNTYFTIRNREVGTKHVFAGSTRVASKMMKQDKPNANPKGKPPEEKDRYFYHPDHLGSSAYITDAKGDIYQHLEYFPWGDTFVEEVSATQRTPYRFTGKEFDEETGLYYFGARSYDPRTSVWESVDPILEQYLTGTTGMGGVFNPFNLGSYSYTHLNPVRFIDPDGNVAYEITPATTINDGCPNSIPDLSGRTGTLFVNGILNDVRTARQMGIDQAGPNFTLLHNTSSGFFGDVIESAYQKARGIPLIGRFLPKTHEEKEVMAAIQVGKFNRLVAHSQGAIILIRALEELKRQGVRLDGVTVILNGPAISQRKSKKLIESMGGTWLPSSDYDSYNYHYMDPVQSLFGTTLVEKIKNPLRTVVSLFGFFKIYEVHRYQNYVPDEQ